MPTSSLLQSLRYLGAVGEIVSATTARPDGKPGFFTPSELSTVDMAFQSDISVEDCAQQIVAQRLGEACAA